MYSLPDLEPVCCSMSSSNCCFLTCIQISQEAGQVIWYSYLFKNFPQLVVIHTLKGFGIVNKAEVDVFLELSCFFDDPQDIGNLISLFPLPFLSPAWTSGISQYMSTVEAWLVEFWALLCQHVRWVQLCSSLSILCYCLSLGLEWKLTFSSPMTIAKFSKFVGLLSATLSQHHLLGFEITQLEFHHLH